MENNSSQVVLVKDIRPGGNSTYDYVYSYIRYLTEVNGKLYFSATDGETGREVWVSDGTTEGTQLLRDINPVNNSDSSGGSYGVPYIYIEFDGLLYFTADNGEDGRELWITDGTTEGTQLLRDINPDETIDDGNSFAYNFTVVDNKLFFTANDGENGRELWITDGTTNGTQLLRDIYPGINSYGYANNSYPDNLTEFDEKLYFTANNGENGNELWVSDGTTEGTQLVKNIRPGSNSDGSAYSSYFSFLTEFNRKLYFIINDGNNGSEIWVTDGTTEGTQLIKNISPDSNDGDTNSYSQTYFNVVGDKLYLITGDGENSSEIWISDGTTEGTQFIVDIDPGNRSDSYTYAYYDSDFTIVDDKLYFKAKNSEFSSELWVTDGTVEGTQLLIDTPPNNDDIYAYYPIRNFTAFKGKLYFTAKDRENGDELWVSDGTTENTQLLVDINPNNNRNGNIPGSYARGFTEFDGLLYFSARDQENGDEVWVTDGTTEGTQLVADINPEKRYSESYAYDSNPRNLTEFNGKLYFNADDGKNGEELWVSEGTAASTQLVKDINPNNKYFGSISFGSSFTEFNGLLYFSAGDGENGEELWVSDGTTDGTQLVLDINPKTSNYSYDRDYFSSFPRGFTEFNGLLYFTATDEENGKELWVTDGTTEGTQLLIDINPGNNSFDEPNSSYPGGFTEFDGKLYFSAIDEENGEELWVTDGTTEGTELVLDINPSINNFGFANSSNPNNFKEFDGKLYFSADDGETGSGLWVTDGTTEGTQLIYPGIENSFSSYFTEFDGKLYFSADDGETGSELWVTDGTTEGTQLIKDVNSNMNDTSNNYSYNGSYPSNFTEFNGLLYFSATDEETGRELWVSDGTAAGTQLLVDINPGTNDTSNNSSSPEYFTEFNGLLYFSATDEENGSELWVSDGTSEGTQLVLDINPGTDNSYPSNFAVIGDKLYFNAENEETGEELWVSDGTSEGTQLVIDINPGSSPSSYGYGSSPRYFTVVGEELFFTADNGESGTELFKLFEEPEMIIGTDNADNLVGTDKIDLIEGRRGNDTLYGGASNDTIIGGCGRDSLFGAVGDDSLIGDNGNDTLDGGGGNDTIVGGCGKDSLFGATGDDSLIGGHGKDTLYGDMGNDTIVGGSGRDSLSGAVGDDSLVGENGNDTIDGGAGDDTLTGGTGRDIFILGINRGFDTITDFNLEGDRIGLLEDLEFENLSFSGSAILVGSETLATLDGVNTQELSENIFEQFELE